MPLPDDYHRFRELIVAARGQSHRLMTKPGLFSWDRLDPGARLLVESFEIEPNDRVLDLGCGCGIVGLVAARLAHQGQVHLVDSNIVAVEAARQTLRLNGAINAQVHLSDGAAAVRDVAFDVVASHLPRGRAVAQQLIVEAAAVLKPGGRFYLAGHKRTGIKPFLDYARQVFGNAQVLALKQSYRVALCLKDANTAAPPTDLDRWYEFTAQTGEGPLGFVSRPGIFSWDRLDAGTRRLIQTMHLRPDDTVLDLGCGYGIVGLVAARQAHRGRVYLADSNVVAVEAARRTLALHGVINAEARLSDCAAALSDLSFDVVVTNPPFHQGRATDYDVAHQFIRDAAHILQRRGRLYVVANRFIRYEHLLSELFHELSVPYEDNLYRVLLATRPKKSVGVRRLKDTPERRDRWAQKGGRRDESAAA
ncbi:MAG: class I SAM-dependent methyltransferase [Chloroflexota bacterium]